MWTDLFSAIALVFILEGIIPFISPETTRKLYLMVSQLNNQTLRFIGLTCMLAGLVLLYLVRS
jgi:hypothetical protein